MWWWTEPLMLTGWFCFCIAVPIGLVTDWTDNKVVITIMIILCVPLIVSVLALVMNGICALFTGIWKPYF